MKEYDIQVHTNASPCSNASPRAVVCAALDADLDGIAITDHDKIANVDAVRKHAPEDLDVVSGVEVTTTEGHLLALYVDSVPVPDDPVAVAKAVARQGGISVLAHPFDRFRENFNPRPELFESVDAIEVVNSRCVRERFNTEARRWAAQTEHAAVGGSDAHFPMEIGRARTCWHDESGLIEAVRTGKTDAMGRGRYLSGHLATKLHEFRTDIRNLTK